MELRLIEYLGGKNYIHERAPEVLQLLCTDSDASNDEAGVYLNIDEIYSDSNGIISMVRGNFEEKQDFLAIIADVFDAKTGTLIDTIGEYYEDVIHGEIRFLSDHQLAKKFSKGDIRISASFAWSNGGKTITEVQRELQVSQFYNNTSIISDVNVTAPRAKDLKQTIVLYDRDPFISEKTDYHYNNVVSPDRQSAKIMLPFRGSASVRRENPEEDKFKITGLFKLVTPEMYVILENGSHVSYQNPAGILEQIQVSDDGKEISWDFNDDWHALLDLRFFNAKTIVDFTCIFALSVVDKNRPNHILHPKIMITSAGSQSGIPRLSGSGVNEIEKIMIQWGCLSRDTLIQMSDGSRKAIENIQIGESILTNDNRAVKICDIVTGHEADLIYLETYNGHSLRLTDDHPVKTARGTVKAGKLTAKDFVLTEEGESQIKYLYYVPYDDCVYNLCLEQESILNCNGIMAGDFDMQNHAAAPVIVCSEKSEASSLKQQLKMLFQEKKKPENQSI